MTDAMFEVPQSRLEEMTAELKRLLAQEAHIQDAFSRADLPIHWTSLAAAVEEMLRRYLAGQQDNADLRSRLRATPEGGEREFLADIEWLLIGSTDSYATLKHTIAHICRDVTNAGCIDELCIHDICAGFRQNGYEVIRKEALANLRAGPPPSMPASGADSEQALHDKDLKIAELQERLRRTESANLALRTELQNVRYQWRETIDRSVKLRDKLRGLQAACLGLLDYCRRAGPMGFQLEKANDYFRGIENCLTQQPGQKAEL